MDFGFPVPYYGFQSPGFRILLQTFTGFRAPQEKTSRIRNPESLTWVDQSRFLFLLLLSSIGSPNSINVCTAQYHNIFILFVQRLSSVLFLFVSTERPRALFAAEAHTYIENRNLSMPENLVMTSAHALCPSIQTLSVRLKNLVGYRRKSQIYVLLFLSTNN